MRELNLIETEQVSGAGALNTAAIALGGAAAISGGLAAVPTPASPSLAAFAVVTGVLSATLAYADSKLSN